MKNRMSAAALVGTAFTLAACATSARPSARAAQVERIQCSDPTAQRDDVALLQTTTVLQAEPIYSHVISGRNNAEDRVSGAKLLVRPPEGVSAERMTRILQCHSARVLLGQVDRSQFPDDPYVLPDAWVDIDVKPEAGNFAVTLQSDSVSRNLQVLNQATAYAGTHRQGAIP
jgi:hypothetical protein